MVTGSILTLNLERVFKMDSNDKSRGYQYMPGTIQIRRIVLRVVGWCDHTPVCMQIASTTWEKEVEAKRKILASTIHLEKKNKHLPPNGRMQQRKAHEKLKAMEQCTQWMISQIQASRLQDDTHKTSWCLNSVLRLNRKVSMASVPSTSRGMSKCLWCLSSLLHGLNHCHLRSR